MLSLTVRGAARPAVPLKVRRALRRQLARAVRAAGAEGGDLCLSLSDDAELRELNRQFAGEDHATDVLSFAQQEGPGPDPSLLGDVVISVETAARQAQAAGHGLLDELLHLSVHGLCHLLGYDHDGAEEERRMFGFEALLRAEARGRGAVRRVSRP